MRDHALVQYHCCFLLERQSTSLSMAIAWRRFGAFDYGLYLTKRSHEPEGAPVFTVFRASYGSKGEIVSFFVSDGWPSLGEPWQEDHVNFEPSRSERGQDFFSDQDNKQLSLLADAFCGEWLESFGATEAVALLKGMGVKPRTSKPWESVLKSGLPAAIKKQKLPDVLRCLESAESGHLYCFMPFPERPGHKDLAGDLLQAKMQMFFELL